MILVYYDNHYNCYLSLSHLIGQHWKILWYFVYVFSQAIEQSFIFSLLRKYHSL